LIALLPTKPPFILDSSYTGFLLRSNCGEEDRSEFGQYVIMVENSDGMLRVFWPNNITRTTSPGVIVGWRNSNFDLFVITVLEDVEVRHRALLSVEAF
jgi:hypothetical protein